MNSRCFVTLVGLIISNCGSFVSDSGNISSDQIRMIQWMGFGCKLADILIRIK